MQSTQFLYRPVLIKAWQIVFRNKLLWLLGLLSIVLSAGGEFEILMRGVVGDNESVISTFISTFFSNLSTELTKNGQSIFASVWQMATGSPADAAMTAFVLLGLIVLIIFIIWLAITAEIAVIRSAVQFAKSRPAPISETLEFSRRNFWPVTAITVAQKIIMALLFALFGTVTWLSSGRGWLPLLIFGFAFLIFSIIVLVISFILKYQTYYVLLKNRSLVESLKAGIDLFKKNWLISLEMAIILFGVYLVSTYLCLFLLTIFSAVPLVVLPFYLASLAGAAKMLIAALSALALIICVAVITGFVAAFQWVSWTILFTRLDGSDETSKLERVASQIKEWPQKIMGR